jgi:hypothetical protein
LVFGVLAGFGSERERGREQQRQQREQAQLADHAVIPLAELSADTPVGAGG